jgi:hypothetical protein
MTKIKIIALISLVLTACGTAADPTLPPCDQARAECFDACPVDTSPSGSAQDACEAACNTEHGLCVVPVPPAPEHAALCIVVAGGTYECDGVPIQRGHR